MEKIKLDKPIYVGFSILDISKTLMYDFHYKYIKKLYGDKSKLLFTDTDSLCYEIKTENIYQDMYDNKGWFDLSDVSDERLLKYKCNANKKVVGKMKPEHINNIITEFIGLRSKIYSLNFDNGKEEKKAKGVVKCVVKNDIRHNMYRKVLDKNSRMYSKMNVIRSVNHQLYMMSQTKVSLSAYDDKRYILNDGISSYAYGHWRIQ